MNSHEVTVTHTDVSVEEVNFIQKYFLDPYTNTERNNRMFTHLQGDYDDESATMTIRAECIDAKQLEIGRAAVEKAFEFAREITSVSHGDQ